MFVLFVSMTVLGIGKSQIGALVLSVSAAKQAHNVPLSPLFQVTASCSFLWCYHLSVPESDMRKFLVILDDSRECLNAMRFAAMRAAKK